MSASPSSAGSNRGAAVAPILQQHWDEAVVLFGIRAALTRAPNVKLKHLSRFDRRLAAHLDGLQVAGPQVWSIADIGMSESSRDALAAYAVCAILMEDAERLSRLFALANELPAALEGLIHAFGWLEHDTVSIQLSKFLASHDRSERSLGVTASAIHRVDPGLAAGHLFKDADACIRSSAFRAAGELGRREFVSLLTSALGAGLDGFWAAWAAVLLGDRHRALALIGQEALADQSIQSDAFPLALMASNVDAAHALLQQLAVDQSKQREVIRGSGYVGDAKYVPWVISHMSDELLARVAGEAFCLITGLDLAWLDLERKPPEDFVAGPNDDPADGDVAMDEDDGLPWPDQAKVQAWWNQNSARFATGVRYFMGAPPSRAHCIDVLKNGYQRQRVVAAYHLCLLNPGTPLFEWRAPAWRQQRELALLT